jgi:hypothetical protein
MNDPLLVLKKLNELAYEAMTASTEIEKAALFGAVRAFVNDLEAGNPGNLGENIERARWSICAILGYDITNGHDKDQHLSWALAALGALERGFSRV